MKRETVSARDVATPRLKTCPAPIAFSGVALRLLRTDIPTTTLELTR